MAKPARIEVEGIELAVNGDDEPRIKDTDLAERLGYERPRTIRDLVKSLIASGKLNESEVRRATPQTSSAGGRPGTEYWLTEEQALFVAAKSETEVATQVLKHIIRVFMLARRGLVQRAAEEAARHNYIWHREAAIDVMKDVWPPEVVRALRRPDPGQAFVYGLKTISAWIEEGMRLAQLRCRALKGCAS